MPSIRTSIVVTAVLLVLAASSPNAWAQSSSVPLDTSFTTQSAWEKVRHEFPVATIARVEPDSSITTVRGIVYASRNGRELRLDVYRPKQDGLRPAVLIIHGGGWRSGNKEMEGPMAASLAGHGYVALTIEYRLSGEARFPAALDDLRDGLQWMYLNQAEAGIDTARIAVLGPSAGGTLALLLGTTQTSACIKAMVSIDGVADLTDPAESGKDTNNAELSAGARWIGFTYAQRPDLWRAASPVYHAGPHSPPVLFINSSIPRFQAGRNLMMAKLTVSGVSADSFGITQTPHTFWLFHPWFEDVARAAIEFLDKTLRNTSHEPH